MCATCGCSEDTHATLTDLAKGTTVALHEPHEHPPTQSAEHVHAGHEHPHRHAADHTHAPVHGTTLELERKILAKNNQLAARNRGWLAGRSILAVNLVSSPG